MTIETIFSIIAFALSVAGLVPAFTKKKQKRTILLIISAVSLVGILGGQVLWHFSEERKLEDARNDITSLFSSNNPMSFEQIRAQLYHYDDNALTMALDQLEKRQLIHDRPVDATSASGEKYVVRVFNSSNFEIP
jgi:hypothetical protein